MDSNEIRDITNSLICPKQCSFLGVFPRDLIPKVASILHFPASCVVNSDTSRKKGEHWIAFYYSNRNTCEFFDSYGLQPAFYNIHISPNVYNTQCLQSNQSTVCGQYCIYYLYHRSRYQSLHRILKYFTSNCKLNDIIVAKFTNKHLHSRKRFHRCKSSCPINQCCHCHNLNGC
jgi:hypothetical protein